MKWASTGLKDYNWLVTVHSIVTSQLFSSCCRMWIAHVLHANEWKQQNGVGKERRLPGVKGDGCCHLRWLAVAETVPTITIFTGSSPAFTISLCFLFFSSILLLSLLVFFLLRSPRLSLLSCLGLLSLVFSWPLFFLVLFPPVFIGKK